MSHSKVGAKTNVRAPGRSVGLRSKQGAKGQEPEPIVIDEAKGLIFKTERDLYAHFLPQIQMLETEILENRLESDVPVSEHGQFEALLQQVFDDPDEVWEDAVSLHGVKVTSYVGHFITSDDDPGVYYVALAYAVAGRPRFVYTHFPSRDLKLVDRFRRGDLVYDRVLKEVEKGAVEGDALSEGDALAVGLYKAMLTLRSPQDILEDKFHEHDELREMTIEEPDEIWRSTDLSGNTLVTFVKQFDEGENDGTWYLAVTVEDEASSSHALLFSFPTKDENLVDRYRHGENLQAEEVTQEASH